MQKSLPNALVYDLTANDSVFYKAFSPVRAANVLRKTSWCVNLIVPHVTTGNNYTAPATGTSDAFVALEGLVAEAP